jgi:hypothetical protein
VPQSGLTLTIVAVRLGPTRTRRGTTNGRHSRHSHRCRVDQLARHILAELSQASRIEPVGSAKYSLVVMRGLGPRISLRKAPSCPHSSLRAKRSNPALSRRSGLLRRFAPRNDDPKRSLRAPWYPGMRLFQLVAIALWVIPKSAARFQPAPRTCASRYPRSPTCLRRRRRNHSSDRY